MFWFSFFFGVVLFRISDDFYSLSLHFFCIHFYIFILFSLFCVSVAITYTGVEHALAFFCLVWCWCKRCWSLNTNQNKKIQCHKQKESEKTHCLQPLLLHKQTEYRPYQFERFGFGFEFVCRMLFYTYFGLAPYLNWEESTLHDQMIFISYLYFVHVYFCKWKKMSV